MLKVDIKHPTFKQIVLASSGIGAGYMDRLDYLWQKQNYKNINVATYTFRNGTKMAMPKYYKNKIFTERERERMWINNLNRGLLWIYGEKDIVIHICIAKSSVTVKQNTLSPFIRNRRSARHIRFHTTIVIREQIDFCF